MREPNGPPIIRIEVEGMKMSVLHMLTERQLLMDEWVKAALDEQLTEEAIKAHIDREIRVAIDRAVREEVDRYYRYGHGRATVAAAIKAQLEPDGSS